MQLIVILGILVAIVGVVFALQNNVPVTVTFIVWRFDSSLAMVLMLALALGALIVALVSTPAALRSYWTIARLRNEIGKLNTAREERDALSTRSADPATASPEQSPPDGGAHR